MSQIPDKNPDRREFQRKDEGVEVIVAIPDRPPMTLVTTNYSDSGIFLLYSGKNKPSEGCEITVTLTEFLGGDAPMAMTARITRVDERGFAIEFLGQAD